MLYLQAITISLPKRVMTGKQLLWFVVAAFFPLTVITLV